MDVLSRAQLQTLAFFRMALACGLVERQAVIAWADRMILESEIPPDPLIEISLAGRLPYSQLIYLLTSYLVERDYGLPLNLVFAQAGRLLQADPRRAAQLAAELMLLNAEGYLPRPVRDELHKLAAVLDQYRRQELSTAALQAWLEQFLAPYVEWQPLAASLAGRVE